jgi:DNA polymerase-1
VNLPVESMRWAAPLFADKQRTMVGWNLKFDVNFTCVDGLPVKNQLVDAMLGLHLANENEKSFALKTAGGKYVDPNAANAETEMMAMLEQRGFKKKSSMEVLDPALVAPYAEQDVILTWKMLQFCYRELSKQGLLPLWGEVNAYIEAVRMMEYHGVLIDPDACREMRKLAEEKAVALRAEMSRELGVKDFNPNSVPQVRAVTGLQVTDKEALSECDHPMAARILEYRGWTKVISSYYDTFLEKKDPNNRVHPNLKIHGTVSGRLSCADPNLQSLPKENDMFHVRGAVVAPPGYTLVACDYSQAELRMLAHYTKDPLLLHTYRNGLDLHTETSEAIGIKRDAAKRINFGIVYGIGAPSISKRLKISMQAGQKMLAKYHARIPGIKKLYRAAEAKAKRDKYISMWTGRRRHYGPWPYNEYHKASSNLIQGGVAEVMRHAITRLHRELQGTGVRMVLQVHDEILFEVPTDELTVWIPRIRAIMEDFQFAVPTVAEAEAGPTWGSMKAWEDKQ